MRLFVILAFAGVNGIRVDMGNVGWDGNDSFSPDWDAALRKALESSRTAVGRKGGDEGVLPPKKFVAEHREVHCPNERAPSFAKVPKGVAQQKSRQEIRNVGSEPVNVYWWDDARAQEILVYQKLQPQEQTKLNTFVGDRFLVRLESAPDRIVLDVTVGVRPIRLPEGMDCVGTEGIADPRPPNPPGPIVNLATFRGWANDSPCDLVGAWVNPRNHTERWMADLVAEGAPPHFEVTYEGHEFTFRLTDGRLVQRVTVEPARAPDCERAPPKVEARAGPRLAHLPSNATALPAPQNNSTAAASGSLEVCPAAHLIGAVASTLL